MENDSHPFFTKVCSKPKKKKKTRQDKEKAAGIAGKLPRSSELTGWLVAWQQAGTICFGAQFVRPGPTQGSLSGQEEEELKPSDTTPQSFPAGR